MNLPLVHFAQRANHGQIHHRPCLGIDSIITPAKTPTPSCHRLLKRAREIIRAR